MAMTFEQFQLQMDRLGQTFGANHYKPDRTMIIWKEFRDLPEGWMRATVDRFIGEMRQAPLLAEFRTALVMDRDRGRAPGGVALKPEVDPSRIKCFFCGDNGVYIALHCETRDPFAFRCHCDRGLADPRVAIPHFKLPHRGVYEWVNPGTFSPRWSPLLPSPEEEVIPF